MPVSARPLKKQTPDLRVLLSHFLRQVESHHVRTPGRSPLPLHYDSNTETLKEYPWPCDPDSMKRVPPSELEAFRRTHKLLGPSCLCALLDGTEHTEARIGVVETANGYHDRDRFNVHGEYMAVCARQRCGYYLCLERFYPLNGLKLRVCPKRGHPLPAQDLIKIALAERSSRAGEGLFQVIPALTIRGRGARLQMICPREPQKLQLERARTLAKGIQEAEFWQMFVQCVACRLVMFRDGGISHQCQPPSSTKRARDCSTLSPARRVRVRLTTIHADSPEVPIFRSLRTSPVPTDVSEDADGYASETEEDDADYDSSSSGETERIPASSDIAEALASSDHELPSILQLLDSVPRISST